MQLPPAAPCIRVRAAGPTARMDRNGSPWWHQDRGAAGDGGPGRGAHLRCVPGTQRRCARASPMRRRRSNGRSSGLLSLVQVRPGRTAAASPWESPPSPRIRVHTRPSWARLPTVLDASGPLIGQIQGSAGVTVARARSSESATERQSDAPAWSPCPARPVHWQTDTLARWEWPRLLSELQLEST